MRKFPDIYIVIAITLAITYVFFLDEILKKAFNITGINVTIYSEAYFLFFSVLYVWGYVFIELVRKKLLSWLFIVVFATLVTLAQTLFYKTVFPPPLGFTFLKNIISFMFGACAVYPAFILLKKKENGRDVGK
jgi:hypothetical protein